MTRSIAHRAFSSLCDPTQIRCLLAPLLQKIRAATSRMESIFDDIGVEMNDREC